MIRYRKNDEIDLDLYEHHLRKNGCFIFYNRDKLECSREEMAASSGVFELMAIDKMRHHSGCEVMHLGKEAIFKYLTKFERCPEHYFFNHKVKGITLSTKDCLSPLQSNGYAQEFLDYYITYKSLSAKASKLKTLTESCNGDDAVSSDGLVLSKLPFNVKREPNYRYNYSDFDIIAQIPKSEVGCIGIEDGYVLAWGDFAQSDFRIAYNLFLRSEKNDAIMANYEDKYEGLARIVSAQLGEEFNKESFLQSRKLYKRLTLATMYGTQGTVVKEDSSFISMFNRFLDTCPRYVEYRRRLRAAHHLGLPIEIESYFGNVEVSPILADEQKTVYRSLNAPIQKGTSEIVILSVCKILKMFYDLGYTEEDISLYFVRHDEPIFKLKKNVMKDSWIFRQFDTILVGNWTPLNLSFQFGYWYSKEDEELSKEYQISCAKNANKIEQLEQSLGEETFFPVKKIATIQIAYVKVGDLTIIAYFDEERNLAHYSVAETNNDDEIWNVIVEQTRNAVFDREYSGIVVMGQVKEHEEFYGGRYIKYLHKTGTEFSRVTSLARYATCRYCKSAKIDCPVNPPLKTMEDFILSVGKMEEIT